MAVLTIENVTKAFGAVSIISGLSLKVADGEFCVLVGPSGCGKSTLLRIIAGLEPINSGRILVDGVDVSQIEPSRRGIAMVFQSYALYPHMTVDRNMGFGLQIARTARTEIVTRVAQAAAKLRLGPYLRRRPRELSGGQRQRVAIGRAITQRPKLFLLDEPLSNLDAALRVGMRVEIARLKEELRSTMVYVTHDQVEAMTLADRIVVMNGGGIEQVGTPLDLYELPDNLFVAGFIGSPSMNFLAGRVVEERDGRCIIRLSFGVELDLTLERPSAVGSPVTVGIRPEHVRLSMRQDGAGVSGVAVVVEMLGSDTFVHVEVGGQTIVVRDSLGRRLQRGELVSLLWSEADCHVFGENGRRLPPARTADAPLSDVAV